MSRNLYRDTHSKWQSWEQRQDDSPHLFRQIVTTDDLPTCWISSGVYFCLHLYTDEDEDVKVLGEHPAPSWPMDEDKKIVPESSEPTRSQGWRR